MQPSRGSKDEGSNQKLKEEAGKLGVGSFSILSLQIITDIPADALGGKVEFFNGDLTAMLFDLPGDPSDLCDEQYDRQEKEDYQGVMMVHGLTISGPSEAYGLQALVGE